MGRIYWAAHIVHKKDDFDSKSWVAHVLIMSNYTDIAILSEAIEDLENEVGEFLIISAY